METHITVQEELLRFLRAAALGASCGVLFDFLRFLRALLPHGAVAVFLEDALFSFMFCFVLQVDAWSFCGGSLRFQHFLAMCLVLVCWACLVLPGCVVSSLGILLVFFDFFAAFADEFYDFFFSFF